MKKITYSMELLSSLIVSPRAVQALYYGIDIFRKEPLLDPSADTPKRTAKVVYPFYQYGEYKVYDPEHTEYYLPGSSVKGALLQKNGERIRQEKVHLMADDILIDRKRIVLRNLEKAQNVDQCDNACFNPFFDNVGVEMLKADSELCGELYLEDNTAFEKILEDANRATVGKIHQMCEYLGKFINTGYNEQFCSDVSIMLKELCSLEKSEDIILVGGYKGLLHSILLKNQNQRGQKRKENGQPGNGIFLDRDTGLPHGLVRMRCENTVKIHVGTT